MMVRVYKLLFNSNDADFQINAKDYVSLVLIKNTNARAFIIVPRQTFQVQEFNKMWTRFSC